MSVLSTAAALPAISSPSVAASATDAIPAELTTKFSEFYNRWIEETRRDHCQDDPDLVGWTAINLEGAVLLREIMSHRPRSINDLALQARACALENNSLWTDRAEVANADQAAQAIRRLIENVAVLAAAEILPGMSIVPLDGEPA